MSDKTVIETIYGKYHKFEIVRDSGPLSTRFYIYEDGKPKGGYYSRLDEAVRAAKEMG
jgi:hypothetical protein